MTPYSRPARKHRGFTLIEVVVVLLILGVMIAMAAAITRGVMAAQKRSVTATRMAVVDTALVQFVLQQKRLPCPADGTFASSANNAGIEGARTDAAGCTTNLQHGIVPWRALGLTDVDVTDGWDRRLTYRIRPQEAILSALDASRCDPIGTEAPVAPAACNPACTAATPAACTPPSRFLVGRGLMVRNAAGTGLPDTILMDRDANPHTGAAYVLISHGESGGGAYLNSGVLSASTTVDGNEELRNYANQIFDPAATYYVDSPIVENPGVTHFDDIVSRPTILAVISKAGLAPRSH